MYPIEVSHLRVEYVNSRSKRQVAVHDLSFSVRNGEAVGFLGPNGAGKTSTLKAIMGFLRQSGGTVTVLGHPAGAVAAKRRMGYLPEIATYYPFLTPLETLTLYGELQGARGRALRHEALDLLDRVGLGHAATTLNNKLSKGMLQRVGVAQALLGEPELLVFDEAASGLDPLGRRQLRVILQELHDRGVTIFFSSHDLDEVQMLCDRILVVHEGRLVEERELNELRASLKQYALTLGAPAEFEGMKCEHSLTTSGAHRYVFEAKDPLLKAIHMATQRGQALLDVTAEEGSLEDYFVDTIGRAA